MANPRPTPAEEALDRHDAEQPDSYGTLPGGVTVQWIDSITWRDAHVRLEYAGWADNLIESGLMKETWLQPTGKHLRDEDGDPISITRSWRLRDGQPTRHCVIRRSKQKSSAVTLPGALLALRADKAIQRWRARRQELVSELRRQDREPSRSVLRLIIDNTREVRP